MKNTKKYLISIVSLVCIAAMCLSLGSCTFRLGTYSLGGDNDRSLEDWLNRDTSSSAEKTNKDSSSAIQDIPASTGSTIKIENNSGDNLEFAVAKGLTSTVSVVAKFSGSSIFGSSRSSASAGSGVIIKLDKELGNALIMTNYHIVFDENAGSGISDDISVFLYGSESYLEDDYDAMAIRASYVGGSMNYDLALLYVEGSELIKKSFVNAVNFSNSDDIRVGQSVLAIGNPGASGLAATRGIVSKESETLVLNAVDGTSRIAVRVVRVDAPINSGNSGGGLFDTDGNLIGIVNAKSIETNVDNIGYAIPSNVVRAIADNIIYYCVGSSNKQVKRALLGITLGVASSYAKVNEKTGLIDVYENVTVESLNDDAIAKGMIKQGDILRKVTLGDRTLEINHTYTVIDLMLNARVGDTVTFELERDGETKTVQITLTEKCLTTVG